MEDKTKQRQAIIATIMVAAIILYIGNSILEKNVAKKRKMVKLAKPISVAKTVATPTNSPLSAAPGAPVKQKPPAAGVLERAAEQQAGWGTNPFTGKSISSSLIKGAAFKLSGLCYNKQNPRDSYAIIDDSIIKVGEAIRNTKTVVKKITENEVILSDGSSEWTLRLW
jgi:type II secretory pathway component PulC